MSKTSSRLPGRRRTLQSLIELVAALDRRVPRPQAAREAQTASDSADLRAWASTSITNLRREALDQETAELRTAQSVMTDDGGPVRGCQGCETPA